MRAEAVKAVTGEQLSLFVVDGASGDEWRPYFAGLLDGEGHIGLSRHGGKRPQPPSPVVNVWMCDPTAVFAAYARYGGGVHERPAAANRRLCYAWRVEGRRTIAPLTDALPFLLVKREQARLVLEVAETMRPRSNRNGRHAGISPTELALRERAYLELRRLNARGPR